MGNSNLEKIFKLDHDEIDVIYRDYKRYSNLKNENKKRDFEFLTYISCELSDDPKDIFEQFTKRITKYYTSLLKNEEKEHYLICAKIQNIIETEQEIAENYIYEFLNINDGYIKFHLKSITNYFEELARITRENNYNYLNTFIQQLKWLQVKQSK